MRGACYFDSSVCLALSRSLTAPAQRAVQAHAVASEKGHYRPSRQSAEVQSDPTAVPRIPEIKDGAQQQLFRVHESCSSFCSQLSMCKHTYARPRSLVYVLIRVLAEGAEQSGHRGAAPEMRRHLCRYQHILILVGHSHRVLVADLNTIPDVCFVS